MNSPAQRSAADRLPVRVSEVANRQSQIVNRICRNVTRVGGHYSKRLYFIPSQRQLIILLTRQASSHRAFVNVLPSAICCCWSFVPEQPYAG